MAITMPTTMSETGSETRYVIALDDCIDCGVCEKMCPNKGIAHTEGVKDYVIVPGECEDCGICLIYCPTDAILDTDPSAGAL